MKKLILFSLLISCGTIEMPHDYSCERAGCVPVSHVKADKPPTSGDAVVDGWVKYFYDEALKAEKLVNAKVTIRLAEEESFATSDAVGYCYVYTGGANIILRTSWWDEVNDCFRGYVVIHELGHCALGLSHTETGVMQPYIPYACFEGDTEKAMKEVLDMAK